MKQFEGNEFAVEVLSRGSFVDATYPDKVYQVETMTLRVNWVAMNEYNTHPVMDREDFDTDDEWAEFEERRIDTQKEWRKKLLRAMGLEDGKGVIYVMQVVSEIFAVCRMTELNTVRKA